MTRRRRFIVHSEFLKQHRNFVDEHPKLEKALLTQYRKAYDNPSAGKPMAHIPLEELRGKVFRLYVGGRGRHRLVYFYSSTHDVVLPAWISPVPRNKLQYDNEPWLECAEQYSQDLLRGVEERFKDLTAWVLLL